MIMQSISDAEMDVMNAVWSMEQPVSISALLEYFSESKGWKSQTLSTFAARLVKKGLLSVKKEKKANYYSSIVSEEEYKNAIAKGMIDTVYNGSPKKMVAALYDGKAISQSEIDELRKWINELE